MDRTRSGLTLVEFLLVLAILGVMVALIGPSLIRLRDVSLVRQGAAEFATALRTARSEAQRYNTPVVFKLGSDSASYTLTRSGAVRTFTLPEGVKAVNVGTVAEVAYQPPYGTVATTGAAFRIERDATTRKTVVGVVGLTGKVVTYEP